MPKYVTMSNMKTSMSDQRGTLNGLLIPLLLVVALFLGMAGFGYWAFLSREDYKDNSDAKVATAVAAAEKRTEASAAKTYAEAAKKPLKTYVGPSSFGAITVQYPKTWSSYVVEASGSSSIPVDGYFQSDFVPDVQNDANSFALRMQLVSQSYDQVMNQFSGNVTSGKATVSPYKLDKVPSVVGSKITGQLTSSKQGTMIVLPLRNMTLKLWVDSSEYLSDFTNIILPNFSFTP
jgi:hypothetical protein